MVEQLYLHYCAHLEEIPPEFLLRLDEDGRERVAADYIACMTDNYAINDFERPVRPEVLGLKAGNVHALSNL